MTTLLRAPRLLVAAMLPLALLSACTRYSFDGPVSVYVPGETPPTSTSTVAGQLKNIDECLVMATSDGDRALIFPANEVRWDADAGALVYLGVTYEMWDSAEFPTGGDARNYGISPYCPNVPVEVIVPSS